MYHRDENAEDEGGNDETHITVYSLFLHPNRHQLYWRTIDKPNQSLLRVLCPSAPLLFCAGSFVPNFASQQERLKRIGHYCHLTHNYTDQHLCSLLFNHPRQ